MARADIKVPHAIETSNFDSYCVWTIIRTAALYSRIGGASSKTDIAVRANQSRPSQNFQFPLSCASPTNEPNQEYQDRTDRTDRTDSGEFQVVSHQQTSQLSGCSVRSRENAI